MDEAERLCDRLAVIDSGRIVALDTPARLVSRVPQEQRVRFRPSPRLDDALLTGLPEVTELRGGGGGPRRWWSTSSACWRCFSL